MVSGSYISCLSSKVSHWIHSSIQNMGLVAQATTRLCRSKLQCFKVLAKTAHLSSASTKSTILGWGWGVTKYMVHHCIHLLPFFAMLSTTLFCSLKMYFTLVALSSCIRCLHSHRILVHNLCPWSISWTSCRESEHI